MSSGGKGGGWEDEIAWIAGGLLAIALLTKLWSTTVRPWAERTWAVLTSEAATTPVVAKMDRTDLLGLAALILPFLVALAVAATRMRRRRKHAQSPDA